MVNTTPDATFDLVPTHLAVEAMRDNGYRNTAYAVAELIDNSIQAGAETVELLCCESEDLVQQRVRRTIRQVAVLDDGSGMGVDLMRAALQFGNGSHLQDRDGIGRFGMGLPSASISQCKVVEIWSWTEGGPDTALYSYINLDEVATRSMREVPKPVPKPLPDQWIRAATRLGNSGTLVVWSRLDRCMWRTANAIIRNSEFLIARMYRRFLADGKAAIRLASFTDDNPKKFIIDDWATANDPGYLITPSSTPAPYDEIPMFEKDGDSWEVPQRILFRGAEHTVKIRFSIAKKEPRENPQTAGRTDYGKHAGRNVGISLVRADRELDMDQSLVNTFDTRERWWGVEVDFPPALDELFGVTNNKQAARNFTEIASNLKSITATGSDGVSFTEYRSNLEEESDPTGPLLDVILLVQRRLGTMRKLIEIQRRGSGRARRRHDPASPEAQATDATRERQQKGQKGVSDADEDKPADERADALAKELEEAGLNPDQAGSLAAKTIEAGLKYTFADAELEGRSFFTVRPVAGEIVIKININHPAYKNLVEVLEEEPDDELSEEQLRQRLEKANRGLKLLLMAWARFEDEQLNDEKRAEIQDIRSDWGRVAALFLKDDD